VQLALDVGSKLLADVQHLLPQHPHPPPCGTDSTPAAEEVAEAAAAAAAPAHQQTDCTSSAEQEGQPEAGQLADAEAAGGGLGSLQQQALPKLVTLLSCLAAIVRCVVSTRECRGLAADTAAFMETAHLRLTALAAAAEHSGAAAEAGTGLDCTSAAASIACTMEALWEAVASAAAAGGEGDAGSGGQPQQLAPLPLLERCWPLVLQSLQLPLLTADDAAALLSSAARCTTHLADVEHALADATRHSAGAGSPGSPTSQARLPDQLVQQMTSGLFAATRPHRYAARLGCQSVWCVCRVCACGLASDGSTGL
jgi:hypothetical protein